MDHHWVVLSLLSAFSLATSDALLKKNLEYADESAAAWLRLVFSLPLLLSLLFFIQIPRPGREFYMAFLIALPIELVTVVMYVRALKISPMSLSLPFLSLTPLFLMPISYFVLGEKASLLGASGILLLTAGSYVLNIGNSSGGILGPFRSVLKEKGSLLMIGVAALYGITSSYGKAAIEHSSPLFFGIAYYAALTLCFTPFALWKGRSVISGLWKKGGFGYAALSGFFYSLMVASHMVAIKMTKVAYMISVKRVSLLIGVLYGGLIFREKNIGGRLLGAAMMLAGFVLIVVSE